MSAADWKADPAQETYEEIRAEIIAAAQELLMVEGRPRLHMGEVARVSGYSRATIYRYFTSKDELIGAAYVAGVESLAGRFREAIRRYDDPCEQLVEGLLGLVAYVRGRSEIRGQFEPGAHAERMQGMSDRARGEMARALVSPILEVLPLEFESEEEERRVTRWLRAIVLSLVAGALSEIGSEEEERAMLYRFVAPSLGLESAA
ncbi:MAG: TetR/AcrR family transcriptional regulator [Deltaproteobacteria bacterium]|jgi:AcrR family transcriptional regulator|nr:TetR/AcrR family transcriptional regulator [Deltaproteobacteria bacterium]